ncbi:MAG: tRNA (adenosine(37)-N6)-threonylcarbamoyltransferase complex ATPase subunit type 1 TsaE [Acidiferrobacteraceae bacterium]|jgi:tRNA threonylcarbamoyladenosine biosynthesis protein TsaE|nr:tRNA (adenosine(37)-N6)-threonylcarbamoyltransferase complex ATPase subunit type 1 TsaE [Acidiferrobacteraceae bacterium]MDP6552429.1 tRNA (adenosine(37)-N6)-threonylcarbamoyltransferase complex ATPase subunit type 1 TsaE [Arenicellales bacterium]MDP6790283.1 tRNA (adenosine(37)-N6)-threonylcarbamoyltransferase complex ATPase subunit type 1 TsaE [Arenicellales bacterium]MDP6918243.1 tRNA (adenosine(37)-N6)-threonylcarbamoyltransferase complex ATPase subunit type 1 TsaE [Arenicellales bacteriu|tara:strand:- start:165 stop:584 length:420 start_codon:yes stop_codon:yes gene_type:complete
MEGDYDVTNADQMRALGESFAGELRLSEVVFLEGDLGSGKTTFAQGVVGGLGSDAAVVSPTYTLVEEYLTSLGKVHHLDLYRIESPDEVEGLAIRDRYDAGTVLLVEWPDRGTGFLPSPDWRIHLRYSDLGRSVCILRN